MQSNGITDVGALALAPQLEALTALKGVNPGDNAFGVRGVRAFLRLLPPHGNLDTLYLHSSTCRHAGSAELVAALQRCPDTLGVSVPCEIDTPTAMRLGNALALMRDLNVLAITAADLDQRACAAPAAALWPQVARLTGLTFLFLAGGMHLADLQFGGLTRLQVHSCIVVGCLESYRPLADVDRPQLLSRAPARP